MNYKEADKCDWEKPKGKGRKSSSSSSGSDEDSDPTNSHCEACGGWVRRGA